MTDLPTDHGRAPSQTEAARIRDMPAPRESKGLAGKAMRWIFVWPFRLVLAGVYRAGFRAWQLTLLSLATNAVLGWLLLTGARFVPGILLIPAGLFDILDGAVARLRGEVTRWGAFLDSFLDRIGDVILFGSLYWSLSGNGDRAAAGLALATLVISLFVSHIRAEAEDVGIALSEGLFQRLERYVAMMIGLMVPGALLPMLVILTVLGGLTVLQRGWSAIVRVGQDRSK